MVDIHWSENEQKPLQCVVVTHRVESQERKNIYFSSIEVQNKSVKLTMPFFKIVTTTKRPANIEYIKKKQLQYHIASPRSIRLNVYLSHGLAHGSVFSCCSSISAEKCLITYSSEKVTPLPHNNKVVSHTRALLFRTSMTMPLLALNPTLR